MLILGGSRAGAVLNPNVRSRPVISGGTLRTDTGQIIRAGRVPETDAACRNPSMWAAARQLGLNCMRVGVVRGSRTIAQMHVDVDQVVSAARDNRMYVMLGNPDALATPKPGRWSLPGDMATNKANSIAFWGPTADRYRNEPHVFYEMLNEPEMWGAYTNYSSSAGVPTAMTVALREVFDVMRSAAPDTVICAPSPANIEAAGGVSQYIRAIQAFESLGAVDWTRTVWSFHGYNSTHKMMVDSMVAKTPPELLADDMGRAALTWLKARYPLLGTEANWWMEAPRAVLIDVADVMEDVQIGHTIMAVPGQLGRHDFPFPGDLYESPGYIVRKYGQLRSRGYVIPVE